MTEPVVLVVGSLHYDIMVEANHLPRKDETAVGQRWYPKFGGKGGNQAVAVAQAGARARMMSAVGDDGFGVFLRQNLTAAGVDDRFVRTVSGVGSGMSVAILDPTGDYAATIVSGANLAIAPGDLSDPALWDGVGLLVLQNEVPEAVNLAAATEARARGIPTLLNAAPARMLSSPFAQRVDILVVNAVEAEMMGTGPVTDLDSAAAAATLLSLQFPTVIVTAGAQGLACQVVASPAFAIRAEQVRVVSTHGAGDAFIGALADALSRGIPLRTACQKASIAAAAHVAKDRQA
jgi:ribokinase